MTVVPWLVGRVTGGEAVSECMRVGLDIGGQRERIQDAPTYPYHRPSHIKEHKAPVAAQYHNVDEHQ